MAVEDDFLETLRVRPYDHAVRQVYADWLEEQGDDDRAAVLRAHAIGSEPAWAIRQRVSAVWLAIVDPIHARRDPTWIAAALGDPVARATLGELAPKLVGRSTRDADLRGWPATVSARLAIAAAREALALGRSRLHGVESSAADAALARVEAELAARGELEQDPPDLLNVERTLVAPGPGVRFHVMCAVRFAVRACGPDRHRDHRDQTVASATALALGHGVDVPILLAWMRDGVDRRRALASQLEGTAIAAVARVAAWQARAANRLQRAMYEGDPVRERIEHAAEQRRKEIVAADAIAAAERARRTCPPDPPIDAVIREFFARVTAAAR